MVNYYVNDNYPASQLCCCKKHELQAAFVTVATNNIYQNMKQNMLDFCKPVAPLLHIDIQYKSATQQVLPTVLQPGSQHFFIVN